MADFVAVIRRAVDGLANNTPEMRIRVYDKARSAVQRQLENMKPRPTDDMLRRQMEKLEAAIESVEKEHAEALPPADEQIAAEPHGGYVEPEEPAAVDSHVPAYEEPHHAAHEAEVAQPHHDEPVHEEPAPHEPVAYHAPEPEPAPVVPVWEERHAAETDAGPTGVHPSVLPMAPEPVEDPWQPEEPGHHPEVFAEPETHQAKHEPAASHDETWRDEDRRPHHPLIEDDGTFDYPASSAGTQHAVPVADDHHQAHEDSHARDEYGQAAAHATHSAVSAPPVLDWPPQTSAPEASSESLASDWDLPELPPISSKDAAREQAHQHFDETAAVESFNAHFEEPAHVTASARMPAVSDMPDLPTAAAVAAGPEAVDPLANLLAATPRKSDPIPAAAKPESDPWNDLEQLIGYEKASEAAGAAKAASSDPDELPPPPRAYRATPKPRRSYATILLALVGLAVVAGGGYAVWLNRGAIDNLISGVMGPQKAADQPKTANGTAKPAPNSSSSSAAPASNAPAQAPQAQAPASPSAATAANTTAPVAGPQKFTQRLLPDGTEVDQGAGSAQVGASGQSVAQSTPAAAGSTSAQAQTQAQAQAPAAGQAPGTQTPATPSQNTPPANPANTPAVTGEKIFLYEERIGQSSPTAIDGTVSWSLQHEPGENGRQESVVQGRISVPGRGMTALITFKRNADASLPASHLVELVFSLPQDFEGGAIDSVQRIAMKQTEQDRGTPLVAVPAKITDDFHMIALNDFPDARANNLELLRSRNWMDIPLVYRNGRRALLTLQKGSQGVKAFEDAIRDWKAAAPAKSGQ
ncbi:hypothetical protein [Rhizobium oryzicola]|uniref:Transcriptional regulator n=1 Tax=Rhizobium oryzicola TaxID=1232668 RepID=A0ABT8SVR4_9HYPH|nr:hypothetical protein [Rhizobium oryzicola]MDO1582126.1 hypothetical protein [Rhizobium oryzicola]